MKALLLLLLLLLPACQTISYHADADNAACQAEADAHIAALQAKGVTIHDSYVWENTRSWVDKRTDPNNWVSSSEGQVRRACLASKPMLTRTQFGGYGD